MVWFRRKKEEEITIYTNEVPVSTMVRWFIHDVGYGEDGVDDLIGLPPVSEEGLTKEIQDSDERLEELGPLVSYIGSMSKIAGNVLSTIAVLSSVDDEDAPVDEELEEVLELINELYTSIAFSSILGAFSVAEALGLISINAITSEVEDMKGLFDE
jgi:hypothetical protein